ncbi:transporter substrate-binding domain-containing protein [Shewanella avicenniae]|uniref:Transporter substrate-binding domain-containing protein n=1 Tax=Shewanella avicenniae TaxID=2814294 RepID=A0ABX7QVX1_9GAMM|nr:transporter substrate-binding domain-containing protein [Shewanella avicenniae]QSX34791.1 transporter substrate-binding domain-containing protein [Shewanella avicenniae]
MNNRRHIITLILTITLVLSGSVQASDAPSETVTFNNDIWFPYVDDSPSGGMALEIIRAALGHHQKQVTLQIKPWSRAFHDVTQCQNDLVLAWYVSAREQHVYYSHPFLKNRLRLIKRNGDSFEYTDEASLKGKRIGTIRGYDYQDVFHADHGYSLHPNSNLESNLKMLQAGRLDLIVEDEIVASSTIFELNMGRSFNFTGEPLNERELFVVTGRCNPAAAELLDAFNDGLEQIKVNGEYAQIFAKHGAKLQSRNASAVLRSTLHLTQQRYAPSVPPTWSMLVASLNR